MSDPRGRRGRTTYDGAGTRKRPRRDLSKAKPAPSLRCELHDYPYRYECPTCIRNGEADSDQAVWREC